MNTFLQILATVLLSIITLAGIAFLMWAHYTIRGL